MSEVIFTNASVLSIRFSEGGNQNACLYARTEMNRLNKCVPVKNVFLNIYTRQLVVE